MVTVKTPPAEGRRETSPREVENVERSSWASCVWCQLVGLVCGSQFILFLGGLCGAWGWGWVVCKGLGWNVGGLVDRGDIYRNRYRSTGKKDGRHT